MLSKIRKYLSEDYFRRIKLPVSEEDFKNYPAYGGVSIVNFNSSYMEVVDSKFSYKGEPGFWLVILVPIFFSLLGLLVFGFVDVFDKEELVLSDYVLLFIMSSFIVINVYMIFFLYTVINSEFMGFNVVRVIFSRRGQCVFFLDRYGALKVLQWEEIYAVLREISLNTKLHMQIEFFCCKDRGGSKKKPLFVLGFYADEYPTLCYWEFIRSYMEEEVVQELAETIPYCANLFDGQETFWSGFLTLVNNYIDTRVKWIWLPVMLPYTLIAACFRWIGMRTGKTLVWPEEVQQACAPDENDPVRVDASFNLPNRWGHTFMTLPSEYYVVRRKRIARAQEKIVKKLSIKYASNKLKKK